VNSGDLLRLSTATLSRDVVFTLVGAVRSAGVAMHGARSVPFDRSRIVAPRTPRRGAVDISARARWPETTGTFAYNSTDVCSRVEYGRSWTPQRPSVSELRGHVAALRRRALARRFTQVQNGEQRVGEFTPPPSQAIGLQCWSAARVFVGNKISLMAYGATSSYDAYLSPTVGDFESDSPADIIVDDSSRVSLDGARAVSRRRFVRGGLRAGYTAALRSSTYLAVDSNFNRKWCRCSTRRRPAQDHAHRRGRGAALRGWHTNRSIVYLTTPGLENLSSW